MYETADAPGLHVEQHYGRASASGEIQPLSALPATGEWTLEAVDDPALRLQLLQLGIDRGARITRLSRGSLLQPLLLSFEGVTLAFHAEAAKLIRVLC